MKEKDIARLYHDKAEEVRVAGEAMRPEARESMLRTAKLWDKLAREHEELPQRTNEVKK